MPWGSLVYDLFAWCMLIGIWAPKNWEYSLMALVQYTTTPIPWITGKLLNPVGSTAAEPPVLLWPYHARCLQSRWVMWHTILCACAKATPNCLLALQLETASLDKCVCTFIHSLGGCTFICMAGWLSRPLSIRYCNRF